MISFRKFLAAVITGALALVGGPLSSEAQNFIYRHKWPVAKTTTEPPSQEKMFLTINEAPGWRLSFEGWDKGPNNVSGYIQPALRNLFLTISDPVPGCPMIEVRINLNNAVKSVVYDPICELANAAATWSSIADLPFSLDVDKSPVVSIDTVGQPISGGVTKVPVSLSFGKN